MGITKFSSQQFKPNSINLSSKVYGLLAIARINSGTGATSSTYLRGDNTWNTPITFPFDYPSREKVAYEISASDEGGGGIGGEALTVAPSSYTTGTTIQNSLGTWLNYASATATINLVQGLFNTNFNQVTLGVNGGSFIFSAIVMFTNATDITNARIWVGLFAADPSANDVGSTTKYEFLAFRYSTASDGTAFWRTITQQNLSPSTGPGVNTIVVTTTPIAINTKYYLKIDATNPASINFYINNVLVSTHTTNLPQVLNRLGLNVTSTNLTALVRNIMILKLAFEIN